MDMTTILTERPLAGRVDALDWDALGDRLDTAASPSPSRSSTTRECDELAALFDGGRFRSTIDMARHRFGDGRYRYFDHPLPEPIAELRAGFYGHLAPVANRWSERLGGAPDASRPGTSSCSSAAAPPARSARRR